MSVVPYRQFYNSGTWGDDDDDWMLPEEKRQGKTPKNQFNQSRMAQRDLAEAEYADELEEAKEHLQGVKEFLAMMGFVLYSTISYDPRRAHEIDLEASQMALGMGD
jgi:hypothetical protein